MPAINPQTCFIAPLLLITDDVINRVFGEVIAANAVLIADLNRNQLNAGIRADNSPITPDYTPVTVVFKQEKGQPTDKVRLFDTGAFYESIFTNVFAAAFDVEATDEKTGELQAKYGANILSLTDENKRIVADFIKPQFITRLRAEIGV